MENAITIITFYRFQDLRDLEFIHKIIKPICLANEIKGTIILSNEGINGTVSGVPGGIQNLINFFENTIEFKNLDYKFSYNHSAPFKRLKLKLKKEIVTLGLKQLSPASETGTYVDPENWNELISDPDTFTLDPRNDYETAIGAFKSAVIAEITTFRQFPQYFCDKFKSKLQLDRKIAMYCTGGIRCEKATSYLKTLGFKYVYHLKGGILRYLENIPKEKSLWQGECFLFDNRVAVDHQLHQGKYSMCYGCRHPISVEDQQNYTKYKEGIYCPYCIDSISLKTIKRATERQKQLWLKKQKKIRTCAY